MRRFALVAILTSAAFAADPSALLRVGRAAARDGEWQRAEGLLERAEEGARLLNNPSMELAARSARIDIRLVADEIDSAAALLVPLPRRALASADSSVWLLNQARIAFAQGDLGQARASADAAWKAAARSGEEPLQSATAILLGKVQLAQGDLDGAMRRWKDAKRHNDENFILEASTLLLSVRIDLAKGRTREASTSMIEAMKMWRSTQDVSGMLAALPLRAEVWTALGDTAAARETWDAAIYIAQRTGLPRIELRANVMGATTSKDAAPQRQKRAREILAALGLQPTQLPPDLRSRLP